MTTPSELYALQEVDVALDRALARLAEIEATLGESEEVAAARSLVEEKRARVEALRARQSDEEWAVDEVRGKAAEVEKKLYGGSVRNPKELEDLQADLAAIQGQVRKREDTLLTTLVEADEAEGELEAAEAELAALQAEWRAGQEALEAEKAGLEPEVEQLQAKRSKRTEGMDRATVSLYQLLRERRGGQAVATVERGMCQGCRITLPMSLLQKARTGVGLVQCVSCERILLVN